MGEFLGLNVSTLPLSIVLIYFILFIILFLFLFDFGDNFGLEKPPV